MYFPFRTRIRRDLKRQLSAEQVSDELLQRHAFARDAGFYRLLPRFVVKARTVNDIATIFRIATQRKRNIVFRAGDTSLSGQAVSDDILVEIKQGWRDLEILEGGKQIKLQPGVIAEKANQHLESRGYRIGPDPGSIRSALIGGIVANNASGIGSGNFANSYQTLASMEMVLPNGLILNTADPQDDEKFQRQAPQAYKGLLRLRDQIRGSTALTKKIRNKYKLKNTSGYALNSFLDFEKPLEILAHLMVGSEGTLGFISNVTLNTIPLQEHRATALLIVNSLNEAAGLVPKLKRAGSYALEIMDDAAIRAVQHITGLPDEIYGHLTEGSAALLIEFQAGDPDALSRKVESALQIILEKQPHLKPQFFNDPAQRDKLWKMRRELGPLHAATRPHGTTVLSEDVCFKVKDLARAIKDLKFLLKHYDYTDAVIFGHAGDGNLHFKLSLDLSRERTLQNYRKFMEDLVELVINKYDGSLKAEHGTGRNMAPFVQREWGTEAYRIMQELKLLLDPSSILNPDVLISSDDQIHLKNIKPIPRVDPLIDKCIECGLCEPWCPSADLTLTPRQRINVLREIEMYRCTGEHEALVKKLTKAFRYSGIETCATDGLCGLSCPMDIDTGSLMKQLRADNHGSASRAFSQSLERNFSWTMIGFRSLMRLFTPLRILLKNKAIHSGVKTLATLSHGAFPALNSQLGVGQSCRQPASEAGKAEVIYFPSCLSRGLSDTSQPELSVPQAFQEVLEAADIQLGYPQHLDDLCCGLTFSSKGFPDTALQAAIRTTEMLWISSLEGQLPIVMDTSPCSNHLKHYDKILSGIHLARWRDLKIMDMVEYLHDKVLDKLSLWQVQEQVVLHLTCSTRQMGIEEKMKNIAQRCARKVVVPLDTGCCGFAGDRGFLVPELTESATTAEAREVKQVAAQGYYSTSRTCEIGMSLATDQSYQSLITLVHKALIRSES
ncbi:MAG: FAD-binding and (Fe-S)-binding domain-containing protein [Candidatus Marinimicrobia bacterium]|nr:FAD-binding and (Fe-S)-binding domain-containing protein [Candidatus Neomarinimicrobiota bacterium]